VNIEARQKLATPQSGYSQSPAVQILHHPSSFQSDFQHRRRQSAT
jgi:hypothetical protein